MIHDLSPDWGDNSTTSSASEVRNALRETGFKKRSHRSFEIRGKQKLDENVRSDNTERPIVIKANDERIV
jgi:hypothetical protein